VFHSVFQDSASAMEALTELCFPEVRLYLDVTFGRGVFWGSLPHLPVMGFDIEPSKAKDGVADFRTVPFKDDSFEVGVLDPPYQFGGPGGRHERAYGVFGLRAEALMQAYFKGIDELRRVCRVGAIVKCQDSVEHGSFKPFLAVVVSYVAAKYGEWPRDMALIVPGTKPMAHPAWQSQKHLRKRHSYLIAWRWGQNKAKNL